MKYAVILPMAGDGTFELCRCDTVEAACEVVRILLLHCKEKACLIQIQVVPAT